jgi:hypothetical protein
MLLPLLQLNDLLPVEGGEMRDRTQDEAGLSPDNEGGVARGLLEYAGLILNLMIGEAVRVS